VDKILVPINDSTTHVFQEAFDRPMEMPLASRPTVSWPFLIGRIISKLLATIGRGWVTCALLNPGRSMTGMDG
jgi:hypothetical protein